MAEKTLQKIDIFISSPSDVDEERKISLEVIEQLNSMPHIADCYTLKPLAYEKIVPPAVGETPQRTVDRYMMQADKADIFICILWSRMGTSVIDNETGNEYQSGTEYEFTAAYQANQKSGKPYILLYRGMKNIPMDADFKQAELVKAFFKRFEGKEAELKGLYKKYESNEEFRKTLFQDIDKIISSNIIKPHAVGGAGIKAGGNVTFGDISGQVAIGENIQIIVNKDGSKSWLYTNGIRPAIDPANIFGRQQELEKIDEFFRQTSALAITGISGTGKSTLAGMYLDRIEKRGEYAGIYWRRVNETIEIGDVVGSFFTAIGKPIKDLGSYKDDDKLALLFRELNAAPYFLVFDNFEILLDPQTNAPLKAGFSDLIEKTNESIRSRVLFTSWECPASERGIRPKCYPVGGLDEQAAIQLLRRKGLNEPQDELKKAAELAGGHPLALILLVQLVEEGAETLAGILKDHSLWIGEEGEVAKNILDKVYKERLSEEERKLLQYVSLYREPVPSEAIVAAANDPVWNEAFVKKIAFNLTRKSLLQKTGENYWEESLIHQYAYIKLPDRVEQHKLVCQYYLSLPLPEIGINLPLPEKRTKKEDVPHLIEAHYHACMAKEYDKAAGIIFDYNLDRDLFVWGNYRTLIDLYIGVLPKDHFRDKPLLSDIKTHSWVLGNLGYIYQYLGKVKKAIGYFEKALEIAQEIEDKINESRWLGGLGNAYSSLNEVKKAIEYFVKALKIDQEIGDKQGEGARLGNLGTAYYVLGEGERAIEHYEKALKIAQEINDEWRECRWLGNLGNTYYALGEVRKAVEYDEKALKIAQEIGDRRNEGAEFGNLGKDYYTLGEVKKAIEYYKKALKIAQEIGNRQNESLWLNNLGIALKDEKRYKEALACYLLAKNICTQIEDSDLETTESNLINLKEKLGAEEFEKLAAEVAPRAEEIVREMMEWTAPSKCTTS